MKWFILLGILAILPMAYSYTPDTYTNIQTTLQGDYTPDDYRNIITILDKSTASSDINLSFGPPNTNIFRFETCGTSFENTSVIPTNQTDIYGIDKVCNNGTISGNLQVKLSNSLNTGWTWKASNTSISSNLITLTTSYQTIYNSLGINNCVYIWHTAICSNVNQNPGAYEDYQIV